MKRVRTVASVMAGAIIGGLMGWYPLAWVLGRLVPPSLGPHVSGGSGSGDGFGSLFGSLIDTGIRIGLLVGIATTLGVCGGLWGGWLLAHRTERPKAAPVGGI